MGILASQAPDEAPQPHVASRDKALRVRAGGGPPTMEMAR